MRRDFAAEFYWQIFKEGASEREFVLRHQRDVVQIFTNSAFGTVYTNELTIIQ